MLLTFSSSVESADTERRVIAGKIVPYEVVGNTSAGPVVFAKDSIDIGDPGKIKMLMQHQADKPIGRMQKFQKAEDGIYASFKISASMQGSDALTLASEALVEPTLSYGTILPAIILRSVSALSKLLLNVSSIILTSLWCHVFHFFGFLYSY